jgi:polysaccharide biosynthesis transport protein
MGNEVEYPLYEKEIELSDLIRILYRRKRIFLLTLVIIIISSAIVLFTSEKIYESKSKLIINIKPHRITHNTAGLSALDPFSDIGAVRNLETQMEIIRSYPIIENVIKKFDLRNKNGETIEPSHFIKKNLKVENIKATDVVEIIVMDISPERARAIADEIAKQYIQQDADYHVHITSTSRRFIEEQMNAIKVSLAEAEKNIKDFKQKNETIEIKAEAEEGIRRLSNLQVDLSKAQASLKETNARLVEIQQQLNKEDPNFESSVTFTDNPVIQDAKKNLFSLEAERSKLLQDLQEQHPDVLAITSQVEKLKSKIAEEMKMIVGSRVKSVNPVYQKLCNDYIDLKSAIYGFQASISALTELLAEEKDVLSSLPVKEQELARLMRTKIANEKIYLLLKEKYQEYKIAEASNFPSARIIQPANLPFDHSKPKRTQGMIISLLLGCFLGLCFAYLAEMIDNTVKSKDDVETEFGLRVLETIPRMNQTEIDSLFTDRNENFIAAEAFRNIRSNIKFISFENPIKTLMITSPSPEEGKSFISYQTSRAMAISGMNVLLMGCDLRNPNFHGLFEKAPKNGISMYLVGETKNIDDIIIPTQTENLYFIPAGPIPPNPAELLQSRRMEELLKILNERFDIIILDTPPMPFVSDALAISHMVDSVIITVSYGQTSLKEIEELQKALKNANAKTIGVIINNFQYAKEKYGYGKYERYGNGYEKNQKHKN